MSKKSFTGGLNSLLRDEPDQPQPGRVRTSQREITKTSQIGTREGETRATFVVNEELLEKVKAIAYWDRISIREVINKALQDAVDLYEKDHGKIQPMPKR